VRWCGSAVTDSPQLPDSPAGFLESCGASNEGAVLLLLLEVKHSLLSFHPLYQVLDPIKVS
jgi:hypothetical protein